MALRHQVPLQALPVDTLQSLRQSLPLWKEHVIKPAVDRMLEAAERGGDMADALDETYSVWGSGELDDLDPQTMDAVADSFDDALADEGTLLKPKTRQVVEAAYSMELVRWAALADVAKTKGASKAPMPEGVAKTVTIDSLCELSLAEDWHGPTTIGGVRNALNKLMAWAESQHGITMVASIQSEHMKEYASRLRRCQPKSARKDLSYLSSIYQCGIDHDHLLGPNPCQGIPRLKRSERKRVAKTVDRNKALSFEQLHQLDAIMANDQQHSLYLLQ